VDQVPGPRYSARVERYHYRDFVARFDAAGRLACPCGKDHALQTRTVFVDPGALEASAEHLRNTYARTATLWVLSDENTENAAGARWKEMARGFRVVPRVLPARPLPVPSVEMVDSLTADARRESPELIVAIGSGVVSDLGKGVSRALGVPNWCIATAPSVDAFTSPTAALRINGYHGAAPARASETVVCDPEVMAASPRLMILAGLGDLLAKYLAHLDWNIARMVSGEWYCPLIAAAALDSARAAFSAGRLLRENPGEAVRTLTDAALCSGFAMQAAGGSRPAASAEHTMAHFWETTGAARNEPLALHGILAAAASRILLPAYRALHERIAGFEPDSRERLRLFDQEPRWQESLEEGMRPFAAKIAEETGSRQMSSAILAGHLESFTAHRADIAALARTTLEEMDAAVSTLSSMAYPFSPAELGIPREAVLLPLRNIRLLRGRYSSFDLAWELGFTTLMLEEGQRRF
jgi:glycerol-1-phosphate dehydrogenase [NAD(P)+]